jgi:hypothetical protein
LRLQRRLADRLSYANVIATLALFISLGGASYAVVTLPANSVGTKQLRAGAVSTNKLGFPVGISSTSADPTTLTGGTIVCVRAPCPGSGPQVLASLPIVVKKPTEVYVEATGSFTAIEPGKEARVAVSLGSLLERAPQNTVTVNGGGGTPLTVANMVKVIGASQVRGMRVTNTLVLLASQIAPGPTCPRPQCGGKVTVGKINMVAIVLPPLASH